MIDMNIKLCPTNNPITSMFTTECMCKQQQTSQYIIMGEQNGIYTHELQQHLEDAYGVIPSLPTISHHLKKMGITRKKVRGLAEQQTESVCLSFMAEMSVFGPNLVG